MVFSAINNIGINDGTMREAHRLVDVVLDTLECWYIWVISIARDTVEGVHDIRADTLNNTYNFSICELDFTR